MLLAKASRVLNPRAFAKISILCRSDCISFNEKRLLLKSHEKFHFGVKKCDVL